jgi:hypothetical protein
MLETLRTTPFYQFVGSHGPCSREVYTGALTDATIDPLNDTERVPLQGRNNVLFGLTGLAALAGLAMWMRPALPGSAAIGAGVLYFATIHIAPGALEPTQPTGV